MKSAVSWENVSCRWYSSICRPIFHPHSEKFRHITLSACCFSCTGIICALSLKGMTSLSQKRRCTSTACQGCQLEEIFPKFDAQEASRHVQDRDKFTSPCFTSNVKKDTLYISLIWSPVIPNFDAQEASRHVQDRDRFTSPCFSSRKLQYMYRINTDSLPLVSHRMSKRHPVYFSYLITCNY